MSPSAACAKSVIPHVPIFPSTLTYSWAIGMNQQIGQQVSVSRYSRHASGSDPIGVQIIIEHGGRNIPGVKYELLRRIDPIWAAPLNRTALLKD